MEFFWFASYLKNLLPGKDITINLILKIIILIIFTQIKCIFLDRHNQRTSIVWGWKMMKKGGNQTKSYKVLLFVNIKQGMSYTLYLICIRSMEHYIFLHIP